METSICFLICSRLCTVKQHSLQVILIWLCLCVTCFLSWNWAPKHESHWSYLNSSAGLDLLWLACMCSSRAPVVLNVDLHSWHLYCYSLCFKMWLIKSSLLIVSKLHSLHLNFSLGVLTFSLRIFSVWIVPSSVVWIR